MTFLLSRDWGGCDLTIDLKKIDVLPRITLSQMTGISLMLNIGFLMITFNLCLYDSEMREFNRKVKEEGHKMWKEMLDKLEKAEQEKEDAEQ
jgi:hypothetical protein